MQRVALGNTGLVVSRLCFGTGTIGWGGSSRQTNLGLRGLADLLCRAYDMGVTFWDSADQYGSHPHCQEALKRVDRSKVVITTKTCARTAEQMRNELERFRKELGSDYLDIVLLHCMAEGKWNVKMRPVMDVLSEAKSKGLVRAVGCSIHEFGALRTASQEPWVDVVLARINYAGRNMDGRPDKVVPVLEQMSANGKGIYAMKVMGQGELGNDPKRALEYVLHLPCVDAIVVGMESEEQLRQNVDLIGNGSACSNGKRKG